MRYLIGPSTLLENHRRRTRRQASLISPSYTTLSECTEDVSLLRLAYTARHSCSHCQPSLPARKTAMSKQSILVVDDDKNTRSSRVSRSSKDYRMKIGNFWPKQIALSRPRRTWQH